jgi:hypothetical protein
VWFLGLCIRFSHSFDSLASGRCAIAFSPPRLLPLAVSLLCLVVLPGCVCICFRARAAALDCTLRARCRSARFLLILLILPCVSSSSFSFISVCRIKNILLFALLFFVAFDLCRLLFFAHLFEFVLFLFLIPFFSALLSSFLSLCLPLGSPSAFVGLCFRKRLVYPPSGNSYMES